MQHTMHERLANTRDNCMRAHTDKQTHTHTHIHTHTHADKDTQTHTGTHRQAGWQAGWQAGRHANHTCLYIKCQMVYLHNCLE